MWDRIKSAGLLVLVAVVALAIGAAAPQASVQEVAPDPFPLRPPDTASPQDTLRSLRQDLLEAMQLWQAQEPGIAFRRARERALRCLDLSELPPAVRVDYGSERSVLLLEILDRIELPPLEEIPDAAVVEANELTSWTIPNTEITIARTAEGPYAGEFQFTARTVERIPIFYERVKDLPNRSSDLVGIYEDLMYGPGPWLPLEWTTNLPGFAYTVVLEQTVWQWLVALITLALVAAVIVLAYLWGRRVDHVERGFRSRRQSGRIVATILAIPLIQLTAIFLDDGINISGTPLFVLQVARGVALAGAVGWLGLLILKAIGEAIIRFRASGPGAIDAQLVRIVMRVLAIIVLLYVALYLAEAFGIPAAPLIASLGVGGLAIALAVRPTLENIVGGFILFADQPVRVGEFCQFGDKMGTIEEIGLRSIRIRGLDRTLITVPNADFAQLEIIISRAATRC